MKLSSTMLGIAAALAAIVALAGCGSSGPSKADFVKKADALCAQTNKAHPPKPLPTNLKQAAAQAQEELGIRKELDSKLKGLDVPGGSKKDFAAYNSGTQKVIAAIAKSKATADKGDRTQYNLDSRQIDQAAIAREKTAIKLGFKTCGRRNPVQ
jgi:hypothetical protein